jgi:hypothetical protein
MEEELVRLQTLVEETEDEPSRLWGVVILAEAR